MVRQEKIDQVENIKEKLSKSSVSILTDYRGLSGAEITGLRKKLRGNNAEYKVFKNTLAKRAVADAEYKDISSMLEGPTAMLIGYGDPVSPAKTLFDFIKASEKPLTVKGGMIEKKVATEAELKALSALPSREQLIAKVVGGIKGPLYGIVSVLSAPMRDLVYILQAISKKKEG